MPLESCWEADPTDPTVLTELRAELDPGTGSQTSLTSSEARAGLQDPSSLALESLSNYIISCVLIKPPSRWEGRYCHPHDDLKSPRLQVTKTSSQADASDAVTCHDISIPAMAIDFSYSHAYRSASPTPKGGR